MIHLIRVLAAGLALPALAAAPLALSALCQPSGAPATVEAVVREVESEGIKYVFVGERHAVGPVKRFIVELANTLVDRGHDVGLYVEGFRTDCESSDACTIGKKDPVNRNTEPSSV